MEVIILSYQRDRIVETEQLTMPFWDDVSGVVRGYRIFTACRTVNGKIFRLEDHLDRLYTSSERIFMKPPMEREKISGLLEEVIEKNNSASPGKDFLVQIIFSGGLEGDSMKQSGKGAHLYVAVKNLNTPTKDQIENGVALATFPHQRIYPGVKLMNYIGAIVAHHTTVVEHDAIDTLFIDPMDNSTILEGSTFSIFFVNKPGELITPPLDGRILDSVTRRVVLELTANIPEFRVKEDTIRISDLAQMKESFIASTTRSVLPVKRIDNHIIASGAPGPVTMRLHKVFNEYMNNY